MSPADWRNPYRVLVTGSRDWEHLDRLNRELDRVKAAHRRMLVVHGGARGADAMAALWAQRRHVPTEVHCAQWSRWGKTAGRQRNIEMVSRGADICLAFIRDRSAGATHCASVAVAARIPLILIRDDAPELADVDPQFPIHTYPPIASEPIIEESRVGRSL